MVRSSWRDVMSSLRKMLRRCASIVRGLRNSWAPISLEVAPVATRRAMCSSCSVSPVAGRRGRRTRPRRSP
jgi:hypothetical protein